MRTGFRSHISLPRVARSPIRRYASPRDLAFNPPLPLVHVAPPSRPPRVRQGIGKAIAQKLAGQGLSVVLVALQDGLLDATHSELVAAYPSVQFRKARAPGRCA